MRQDKLGRARLAGPGRAR